MKIRKVKSFTKGFLLAAILSSAILNAGTLIDGIYQFAGGETISASEMNYNFQQIRGNVVLDATNSTAINYQLDSPAQQCESGMTECVAGYVTFGNETVGAVETRTDPSASTTVSSTAQGNMSFLTIPTDGFYEITLIADPTSYTISPPDEVYEGTNLSANFAIIKFNSGDASQGTVTSNTSAMTTPKIDGVEIFSKIELNSYLSKRDDSGDGVEDAFTEDLEAGVKKEMYLKAGDGIAVFYWMLFENYYTPVNSDNIQYGTGSIRLKVKQVVD